MTIMRFSLRTLLMLMLLAGPLGAWGWKEWRAYQARLAVERAQSPSVSVLQPIIWVTPLSGATNSDAEREIWQQQRDKISWESFPESTPPSR